MEICAQVALFNNQYIDRNRKQDSNMSLDSLLTCATSTDLKFIFVGGKGGVGKTTSSSAIATLLAKYCNKRVLLVSTDPAHSLSDAFRCEFTNDPKCPGVDNLHVMEVDPSDTMEAELKKWADLAKDMHNQDSDNGGDANDEMVTKIKQFQEWLSGVPGIDEATALSSAIQHIESDNYDMIVFDTAPTGHTLKLLGMPEILEAGIEKLQSWQSTLWGYLDVIKGMGSSASLKRMNAKETVANMLEQYKRRIQKVALMLQDQHRTRFVVVCIAEYLSVSETQRLLRELKKNNVRASHIVVNQLVVDNALTKEELAELEGLAEVGTLHLGQQLLNKTVHACRLTTARKSIQEKYLGQLKSFPETQDILEGICELPLLAEEVTGNDALLRFAGFMVRNPPTTEGGGKPSLSNGPKPLYDDQLESLSKGATTDASSSWTPSKGDEVKIIDLVKSAQYNGIEGTVISPIDPETNRCGIRIIYEGKTKTLALQQKNLVFLHQAKKAKKAEVLTGGDVFTPSMVEQPPAVNKAKALLDDPEIKAMIEGNPKFKDAVEDVLSNPMNVMKYFSDPEMSPLISKAMSKLKF
eukprot:scaffold460_cov81-Skeletonema_menzelii.AAC.15